jgi:hypothetical protein
MPNVISDQSVEETIAWAEAQSERILSEGRPIKGTPLAIAAKVGIKHVERIRLLRVDQMPIPPTIAIKALMTRAGVSGPGLAGMTFGYGVCGTLGFTTAAILAHEFRHVQQYEAAGSIAAFLQEYIRQIIEFGYANAPYEVDARAHEDIRPTALFRR